jgi:hypothetical protein
MIIESEREAQVENDWPFDYFEDPLVQVNDVPACNKKSVIEMNIMVFRRI